jgi:hypothetical protein
MRFIDDLCPPALLYLIFLVVQLGLDASLGLWVTFVLKAFLGFAMVSVLDVFCGIELSAVSWFVVAVPFLITAAATAISMGTGFDQIVLLQMKETFVDEKAVSATDLKSTQDVPTVSTVTNQQNPSS